MKLSNVKLPTWKDVAHFFEKGDLTPLAVVISVAHYGPVLIEHNDNMVVAWMVGALIDLLHFRTVRRLFQVRGRQAIVGHALVAMLTTAMALGYHLRFYQNDWLLALPIPIGIGILAQHAAAKLGNETVTFWRKRARAILAYAKKVKASMLALQARVGVLESQIISLKSDEQNSKDLQERLKGEQRARLQLEATMGELERAVQERERMMERLEKELKLWQERGRALANVNPMIIDIGLMMSGGDLTQRGIAEKHGVSEATVSRAKSMMNGVAEHA